MKYLISACLCGVNCKYNGSNNLNLRIKKIYDNRDAILICPEVMGGLDVPRFPCEIRDEKVLTKEGIDCTEEYQKGALECLKIARENNIKCAILKDKSPSCGCNRIYDGSFNGVVINGQGITARLLQESGIEVISDELFSEEKE